MSFFLCLETSTVEGSVGVFKKEKDSVSCLSYKEWTKCHSEKIPLEIESVVKESGLCFSDLHFLGVGEGPGRFTGVRTAVNAIRSLSFALKVSIFSKSTLKILAEPFLKRQDVSVVCNAFKNCVYFSKISKEGTYIVAPCVLPVSEWLKQTPKSFYVGDAWDFYSLPQAFREQNSFETAHPKARDLAYLIGREFKKEEGLSWADLKPIYLR